MELGKSEIALKSHTYTPPETKPNGRDSLCTDKGDGL